MSTHLTEQELPSFVAGSRSSDLVNPLVLRVIVYHKLLHKPGDELRLVTLRNLVTTEELDSAGRLTELVEVGEELDLHDDVDLAPDAVHGVVDRQPAGHDTALPSS